jgi:HSP20 family protein
MYRPQYNFNNLLNEFFAPSTQSDDINMTDLNVPVDIYHDDDNIVLEAALPGVEKKDISVDLKGRVLTLKGALSSEAEVKEDNYYRKERASGKFERSFTMPGDVDPEKIQADYKDGILKITVPRPENRKNKQITVH